MRQLGSHQFSKSIFYYVDTALSLGVVEGKDDSQERADIALACLEREHAPTDDLSIF